MEKLKVGDRVQWIKGITKGDIENVIGLDIEGDPILNKSGVWTMSFINNNFKLVSIKSFDNPQIGDEYKDIDGNSRFVLGVCGRVIFLSSFLNKNHAGNTYTKEELIKDGFTIVQDKVEEEIPEYTMEEVCKMVGKEIKIKK